jgi:hypothetical protein
MKKIILLIIFTMLSCKNSQESNQELEKKLNSELINELNLNCLIPSNVKDTSYLLNEKNFHFIDSLAFLEREFLKINVLSDTTEIGYRDLIEKFEKKYISLKNIEKIEETELFNCLKILSTKYILFKKSPMQIINNEENKKDLEKIISIYDKITEDGGVNHKILDYYVNNIDLNNRTYRLMLCYLIYEKLVMFDTVP